MSLSFCFTQCSRLTSPRSAQSAAGAGWRTRTAAVSGAVLGGVNGRGAGRGHGCRAAHPNPAVLLPLLGNETPQLEAAVQEGFGYRCWSPLAPPGAAAKHPRRGDHRQPVPEQPTSLPVSAQAGACPWHGADPGVPGWQPLCPADGCRRATAPTLQGLSRAAASPARPRCLFVKGGRAGGD